LEQPEFLPMTRPELDRLGWDGIDVLIVTGDAYVDHPAFGAALLGRFLVSLGARVGLIAQPGWRDEAEVARLGRPRWFAGVTAGALDSMLAHYTAFRKKRSDDAYTPGGRSGARPNRAAVVYANLVRQAFPGLPVVLGGIEASLRRAVHYDFWTDKLRRPILLDAKADLVVYGMAERALAEVVRWMKENPAAPLKGIPGTVFVGRAEDLPPDVPVEQWPSLEEIQADPPQLMAATLAMERHVHQGDHWAVQAAGGRTVVFTPPAAPLTEPEMDALYALPFTRRAHPLYQEPIPAEKMLETSLSSHRGCGGGCAFCSLALHQGRRVASRSRASILNEAGRMAANPGFKGSISDVGGPSAGMWGARCGRTQCVCRRSSCLFPRICKDFLVDHPAQVDLCRSLQAVPGIRHVRVASGLRFDLALEDPAALADLVAEFVGGQLKVAPEHVADRVLERMRKPPLAKFERFLDLFEEFSRKAGKKQFVTPYLMSGFPGTTDRDMKFLADWLARRGWNPRQVQCFVPTPGTVATAMYYAGVDAQGRPIPVAKTDAQRLRQHRMLTKNLEGEE
jgi:uncharacterized radical SAM protein YgiQ